MKTLSWTPSALQAGSVSVCERFNVPIHPAMRTFPRSSVHMKEFYYRWTDFGVI